MCPFCLAVTSGDIGPLIKAVVATNKFEKDMATAFGGGTDQAEVSDQGREAGSQLQPLQHLPWTVYNWVFVHAHAMAVDVCSALP